MTTGGEPLGDSERAELEQLREKARRAREATDPTLTMAIRGGAGMRGARWVVAAVLLVIVALLAPMSIVARCVRAGLLDTDRYLAMTAPLARDPDVQRALSARVTDAILESIDVEQVADQALSTLVRLGAPEEIAALAQPLATQAEDFVAGQVDELVRSDGFRTLWIEANRLGHRSVVAALTGVDLGAVSVADGQVSVDVGPIIAEFKQRLKDRGFGLASQIPEIDATFVVFQSDDLAKAQDLVRLLDRAATWLPLIALLLLVIAVLVAPDRRTALVWGFGGIAFAVAITAIAVSTGRSFYLDNLPTTIRSRDAAQAVYDTTVQPLRIGLRSAILVALIVAMGVWLTGPWRPAVAFRRLFSGELGRVRGRAVGNREPTAFELWVGRYRIWLFVSVVVVGVLVYALWEYPTPTVAVFVTICVIIGLVLVELLGARPVEPELLPEASAPPSGQGAAADRGSVEIPVTALTGGSHVRHE